MPSRISIEVRDRIVIRALGWRERYGPVSAAIMGNAVGMTPIRRMPETPVAAPAFLRA